MKINIKRTIKVATAVLAAAVVFCLATPTVVKTDKVHTTLPVQAAMVTEMPVTTTVPVTTSITTATTVTSTTTTSTSTTSLTSTSTTTTLTSTSTVSVEETEPAAPVTTAEVTEAAQPQAETQREFVVYKPSTHYIHKSTCHWVDSTCYEITDTNDIECRKCSECNPDLEIVNQYVSNATAPVVSDYDYTLLCKIVASEYGGMPDVYERAKIVASVMNMVNDSRWPGSVEAVLDQTCAPWGFNKYSDYFCGGSIHYSAMADAVDYYFNNPDTFAGWTCNQWWGDGKYNHFRTI